MNEWPFGDLRPMHYGVIYIDPPWKQQFYSQLTGTKKAPQSHYRCMDLDAIKALPVGQLAARDCFIVMWSMWNFVAPGYATDVLRAWGSVPKSGGAWIKTTKHGKLAFGTGYGFRGCSEPFLTAAIGRPQVKSRSERNGIITEVDVPAHMALDGLVDQLREHSRKPESMAEALERMFPGVPKCELFACQDRPGWDCWGDQVDKYNGEAVA